MESVKNAQKNKYQCHDCQVEIKVKDKEIKDGVLLAYDNAGEKIKVLKCRDCYEKNPGLKNYQKCEVYSRIVGYLRPVSQWNIGKKQEFEERKEFKEECY